MPRRQKNKNNWDLRPYYPKPNSPDQQGRLFRAPVSARTPESRQPRGYSPERRDEIEQSVRIYNVNDPKTNPERDNPKAKKQLIETLARTKIPTEEITKSAPGGFNVNANLKPVVQDGVEYPTAAQYNPRTKWVDVAPGREKSSHVIAHEIAHGRSWNNVTWHSAQYGMWEGATGAEEGQADAYAKRVSRAPGYKDRSDHFRTGYMDRAARNPNSVWGMNYIAKQHRDATDRFAWLETTIKQPRWKQDALFDPYIPEHDHNQYSRRGVDTWKASDEPPALPKSPYPRGQFRR